MMAPFTVFGGTVAQPSITYGTAGTFPGDLDELRITMDTGTTFQTNLVCERCWKYTGDVEHAYCDECWEIICLEERLKVRAAVDLAREASDNLSLLVRRRAKWEPLPVKRKVFKHHYARGRM